MKKNSFSKLLLCLGLLVSPLVGCTTYEMSSNSQPEPVVINGKDGKSVLTGKGAPDRQLGDTGDSYIDLFTWNFYVKYEDGWKLEGNIKGIQGDKGDTGNTGATGPQGPQGPAGTEGEQGPQGPQGPAGTEGEQGPQGEEGVSIVSIIKTSSEDNVDTYTITYSDEHTSTFTVTNGQDGAQGIQGEKGQDGHTPEITISSDGYWVIDGVKTETLAEGVKGDKGDQGEKGEDGVSVVSIVLTSSSGLVDTYTITYSDEHTSTFTVTNGEDGESIKGDKGEDGHTPVITVINGYWCVDGVSTGIVAQGPKGDTGETGPQGPKGEDGVSITDSYINEDGDLIIAYSDGTESNVGHLMDTDICEVKFHLDGKTIKKTAIKGGLVERPTSFETLGYTITDWYFIDEDNNDTHESWKFFTYPIMGDMDLYATYTRNQYQISFRDNEHGQSVAALTVTYKGSYTLPTLSLTGYTFVGWKDYEDNLWDMTGTYNIAGYTTLYAVWEDEQYTVTFDPDGGDLDVTSQTVLYKGRYNFPYPTKEGYSFAGWFDGDTMVSCAYIWNYREDKTLVAHWAEPNTYTYDPAGLVMASGVVNIVKEPGDSYSLADPSSSWAEKKLEGWYLNNETYLEKSGTWEHSGGGMLVANYYDEYISISNGIVSWVKDSSVVRNITIPKRFKGQTVYKIQQSAFNDHKYVSTVNLPDTITTIEQSAFWQCKALSSINLNDNITSIGSYAFFGCENLSSINIPRSLTTIESGTWHGCTNLKTAIIPIGVTSVDTAAFMSCTGIVIYFEGPVGSGGWSSSYQNGRPVYYGLGEYGKPIINGSFHYRLKTDLTMECVGYAGNVDWAYLYIPDYIYYEGNPYPITSIGNYAFTNFTNVRDLSIGKNVTTIGERAFTGSKFYGITSIDIPRNVTTIGKESFRGCTAITNVTLHKGLTTIEDGAFYGCSGLTSIELPDSVLSIGNEIFRTCTALQTVKLSKKLTSMGNYNFYGCTALTSIVIPKSVTTMGFSNFTNCSNITTIYCEAETKPSGWSNSWKPNSVTVVWGYHEE